MRKFRVRDIEDLISGWHDPFQASVQITIAVVLAEEVMLLSGAV